MIDADYAAINYVSGSHQLDRVLHKVVTFTVSARTETGVRLCLRVKCVRRKLCVQRLVSVRSIYLTGLVVSMSTLAESPTGLREAPRANSSRHVAPPCKLPRTSNKPRSKLRTWRVPYTVAQRGSPPLTLLITVDCWTRAVERS